MTGRSNSSLIISNLNNVQNASFLCKNPKDAITWPAGASTSSAISAEENTRHATAVEL